MTTTTYNAGAMFRRQCLKQGQCKGEARQANGFISGCQRAVIASSGSSSAEAAVIVSRSSSSSSSFGGHLAHVGFDTLVLHALYFCIQIILAKEHMLQYG